MLIVDSQVHIWAADAPERPWAKGRAPHRPLPFSKDDLLREMDAAGVARAVLSPPGVEGTRNDLVLEAARLHPHRFAVVGVLDLKRPDARDQIKSWRKQQGMLGLRPSFNSDGDLAPDWLWAAAEAAGVPLVASVPVARLHLVDQIAKHHPGLKLIIDHLAIPISVFPTPRLQDGAAFAHLDHLLALAKRPNIAVKASSLPSYTTNSYPYRRLHPYIRRVYDAFGLQRMFWGSDLTRLPCAYGEAVTMFTEEIPWLTADDKRWIMGRALCVWMEWKMP